MASLDFDIKHVNKIIPTHTKSQEMKFIFLYSIALLGFSVIFMKKFLGYYKKTWIEPKFIEPEPSPSRVQAEIELSILGLDLVKPSKNPSSHIELNTFI